MVEKKIFVLGLTVVLALGTLGFNWVETILPTAEAHGVQAQLQSRFIRIEDETFNRQSLQTGETLTVQGTLISLETLEDGYPFSQNLLMQETDGKCWQETHQAMSLILQETLS
jgi:hypothetical protein